MNILRPRSRTISVRLSEDELHTMKQRCLETGARSISELARNAMQHILQGNGGGSDSGPSWSEHHAEIQELERKIASLAEEIAAVRASART